MAENYKHLYEQMRKMVVKYQDEIVPGLQKTIMDLKNINAGNCDGCYWKKIGRHSRCSCCRRNLDMKDNYRRADDD